MNEDADPVQKTEPPLDDVIETAPKNDPVPEDDAA